MYNQKVGLTISLMLIILIPLFLTGCSGLTAEEKAYKEKCETSGGTFIKCSGSQTDSFIGIVKGSCEPAGRLKCYCPEMKGLIEQDGVCVKNEE